MLIGHTRGWHGLTALPVLAQTFGPKLGKPVAVGRPLGNVAEENQLTVVVVFQRFGPTGQRKRRVLGHKLWRLHQRFGHAGRTIEQSLPVNAQKSRRQKPHSRKGRIAPAKIVRHFKGRKTVAVGLFTQVALALVGNHYHLILPALANTGLEPVANQKILRNGFNGAARFTDAHNHGFGRGQLAKQGLKALCANIVGNPQAGATMVGAILPRRKGLLHGAGPKGRPTNAKHQHVPVRLDARNKRGHFHFQLGAERQGKKGQFASGQLALEPLGNFGSARLERGCRISCKPMRIGP